MYDLSLKDVVLKHNLLTDKRASKSLGQNFIFDVNLLRKIVRSAGPLSGYNVLEVGCGPGGLTREILQKAPAYFCILEKDENCIKAVQEDTFSHYQGDYKIHSVDATKTNLLDLFNNNLPIKIIANLPYNVGTPLLTSWLGSRAPVEGLTLMLQKEVVERIIARVGDKHYGRLAILCDYTCEGRHKVLDAPAHLFTPPPKVCSSVVYLERRETIDFDLLKKIEKLTHLAFNQRRKKIRSSLSSIRDQVIDKVDLNWDSRAENLSTQDFIHLAHAL